jgi:tetratricopeptide (TPR) repeat protein
MSRSKTLSATLFLFISLLGPAADLAGQSLKGMKAYMAGDFERAIALFKAGAQGGSNKDRCSNFLWLGMTYSAKKQYPEGVAAFEDALKYADRTAAGDEARANCLLPLGGLYIAYGRYKEAAASLAEAAQLDEKLMAASSSGQGTLPTPLRTPDQSYSLLGEALSMDGSYPEAVNAYNRAIELNPKEGIHYSRLSLAYLRMGSLDDAMTAARKGLEVATNTPWHPYLALGEIHLVRKQYEESADACRKAVEAASQLLPKSLRGSAMPAGISAQLREGEKQVKAMAHAKLARGAVAQGDYSRAVDEAGQAAALLVWDPQVCHEVGLVYAHSGKAEEAIVLFDKAIGTLPAGSKKAAPYFGSRSLADRLRGDRESATKDAAQAFSLDPEGEWVRAAQAAVLIDKAEYEAALTLLAALSDNTLARVLEAAAYAGRGDVGRAAGVYAALFHDDPSMSSALARNALEPLQPVFQDYFQENLAKAKTSESTKRLSDAMAGYAEAAMVADEAAAASIRQSVAALLKVQPDLAALPEEARRRALGGDVFVNEGRFERALAEYQAAVGLAPLNPQLHFNAALLCSQVKDYKRAIEHMTIYLQLVPDVPNARAAKDEIIKWERSLTEAVKK